MENNELLQLWKNYDQKLDRILATQKASDYQAAIQKAKKRFDKLTYQPIVEIALAIVLMFFTGNFTVSVWGIWPLTVGAIAFHLLLASALVVDVNLIYRVKSLNYDSSLAEIQKQIHEIKKAKVLEIKLILWGFMVLSGPFVVAFLYLLLGKEGFAQIPTHFWITNGSICLALAFVAAHLSAGLSKPKYKLQKWFNAKLKYNGLDESAAILTELKQEA